MINRLIYQILLPPLIRMRNRLIYKILLPPLIGMALITIILVGTASAVQQQQVRASEEEHLLDAYRSFNSYIETRTTQALTLAYQIANQPTAQQAFAEQDRDRLKAEYLAAYQALDSEFGVPQAQFHLPPARSFLRLHDPANYGDDLSTFRFTVLHVNEFHEPAAGIEVGRGGIGIRGVVPVEYQGQHIGSFEIGLNVDTTTLERMQQLYGGEWQIFLDTRSASIATLEGFRITEPGPGEGLVYLGGTDEAHSSIDTFLPVDPAVYSEVLATGEPVVDRLSIQDGAYTFIAAPLIDYRGEQIGILQVSYPPSAAVIQTTNYQLIALLMGLGISAAVLAVTGVTARRALHPLGELTASAQAVAAGNLDVDIKTISNDEVGQLASSFSHMLEKLRESFNTLEQRMQELAIARRQADEANRIKSEFLATMSHELRTPLNAMIGFSEIMLSGMGGQLDEEATHMTSRIHENSQRLLSLINDVLDLSKIEARRMEIVAHPFSPAEMVDRLHRQMVSLADKKGLEFTCEVASDLPASLLGDARLIERIITNLLSNAIKFTEKGSVRLKIGRSGADQWSIAVTDTGIGIPVHAREYIFDPFRQIDGSSQRAYGGSGLGLAIVRELVRAMNGKIQVESTVGAGSTFTVTLPMVATTEKHSEGITA